MSTHFKHIAVHLSLGTVLMLYLLYSEHGLSIPWSNYWEIIIATLASAITYAYLSLNISNWLDKSMSWGISPSWRLVCATGLNYVLALGIISIFFGAYLLIGAQTFSNLSNLYQEIAIKISLILFVLIFAIQLIALTIQAFRHHHHLRLQKIEIEQEHIHTQFEILRTQLNPHFLFNCLNTISALVYRSPQEAEEFIRSFAKLNQQILATQKQDLVSFEEEMELAKLYLSLMKVRYGEALIVNIDLPNHSSNFHLPPLSLQILLENAIKHNAIHTKAPLNIAITHTDQQFLIIKNNKQPLKQKPESFAMGLDLLRKRYAFFTQQQISITDNEEEFTVRLPLLVNKP